MVGVLGNDLLELVAVEELFSIITQVQGNAGAALGALDLLDLEVARAAADPAHAFRRRSTGTAGFHGDLVGHDEAGVKAHAKLADQLRIRLLIARQLVHERLGAALGDRAQVVDGFLLGHADAGVGDGQRLGGLVKGHTHFQIGLIAVQAGICQRFKAQFVASIRSIGDQLAQENFLVGIQRMRNKVEQLGHFGLEGMGLLCHVFVSEKLKSKAARRTSQGDSQS